MDHDKMAEGRRKAAEKRQQENERREQEAAEREAEKERKRLEKEKLKLDPATIREFRTLRVQIKTFYEEIKLLSKKSPDGAVNKFKLKFLNDVLRKMTAILGDGHRPFPDFEAFDEADLPTNSDVVLMLSHYTESMGRFHGHHTYEDSITHKRKWHTKGSDDVEV